jgi:hypothetical protein
MIRLTWRQFRTQAVVAGGGLVIVAIVAALTGPHLVHLYDTTMANCAGRGDCSSAATSFLLNDSSLRTWLGIVVIVVPGLIGLFWGAPLVAREIEAGTFRLVWTQSVTRTRWLAVKLGLLAVTTLVVVGLLSLMVTWWASPLDRAAMNAFGSFDQRDIVPLGYGAFALALGVTAGLLIRRTLPAMAVTLVAFITARLSFIHFLRPHLFAGVQRVLALNQMTTGFGSYNGGPFTLEPNPPTINNAWVYSTQIVDKAGHALPASFVARACPQLVAGAGGPPPGPSGGHSVRLRVPANVQKELQDCVTKVGARFHELVIYQPGSRYWAFQWTELAIFLGAALVLGGFCVWWVRRYRV